MFGLTADEMSDDEALDRVMNPARNRYRLDILNVSYHSPLMRALHHATYVFEKRLSHTADSQDQRHRMVPASRPLLTFADTERPDFITPRLIAANPRANAVYEEAMADAWAAKNRLLALGVPLEFALYVLPNAKTLRFVESGSLLALLHKWTLRTCFNAQEEIYLASMDELEQVRVRAPAHRPSHRAAVRDPQRAHLAALHRGDALLRRAGVEGLSRPPSAGCDALAAELIAAWLVHLYTASGFVLAFLAAQCRHRPRLPHRLPLPVRPGARGRHRRRCWRAPRASPSGCRGSAASKLDDLVDYLTYVFVPALIVWRALLVVDPWTNVVPAAMLLSSGYGFSNMRREDERPLLHRLPVVLEHRGGLSLRSPAVARRQRRHPPGLRGDGLRADPLHLSLEDVHSAAHHQPAGRGVGRRWGSRSCGNTRRCRGRWCSPRWRIPVYYFVLSFVVHARTSPAANPSA